MPVSARPSSAAPRAAATGGGGSRARRNVLRELLSSGIAGTQDELVARLREHGFPTTQSTTSRDLRALGAHRRLRDDGEHVYELAERRRALPRDMVLAIEHNEAMVVVRTGIGRAPAVGLEVDALGHPEVLGTLAGDDTVLVIPRSTAATAGLAADLRRLAGLAG